MRNRAQLVARLQARLALRYQACDAARAVWWDAPDQQQEDAAFDAWERADRLAEATRKALIRTREAMPYWRWAAGREAEIAAAGYQVTAAGAWRLPAQAVL